jgi:hypothetical protein
MRPTHVFTVWILIQNTAVSTLTPFTAYTIINLCRKRKIITQYTKKLTRSRTDPGYTFRSAKELFNTFTRSWTAPSIVVITFKIPKDLPVA